MTLLAGSWPVLVIKMVKVTVPLGSASAGAYLVTTRSMEGTFGSVGARLPATGADGADWAGPRASTAGARLRTSNSSAAAARPAARVAARAVTRSKRGVWFKDSAPWLG